MSDERLTPEGERIFRELDKLNELIVKVGFQHGQATEENGTDICDVAAFQELGTETIPSRPFMRDSVENNEDKIVAFMQSQIADIISNGKTAEQAFKEIGIFQKNLVQETIEDGEFVPNSPATIRRKTVDGKKGDHPLIDTGTMKNSVNYVIEKKG